MLIIGTLRNYDGDDNGNVKKATGLMSKTITLHLHHAFLRRGLSAGHRSQVRLQATGHRSDHRPQVRSQVTHKNNRTLGKTVLD